MVPLVVALVGFGPVALTSPVGGNWEKFVDAKTFMAKCKGDGHPYTLTPPKGWKATAYSINYLDIDLSGKDYRRYYFVRFENPVAHKPVMIGFVWKHNAAETLRPPASWYNTGGFDQSYSKFGHVGWYDVKERSHAVVSLIGFEGQDRGNFFASGFMAEMSKQFGKVK